MSGACEIERKFLVKTVPAGLKKLPHAKMTQGYFLMLDKDIEIRLRRKDLRYCLTIKSGHGTARLEEEISLPRKQFEVLWPLTRHARVAKTRYQIPFSGKTIELDVYAGPHRGLITADVEFNSHRESQHFRPPPWFGQEITANRRYSNQVLARKRSKP